MLERLKERWNVFSTEQKVSIGLLSVVGVVTLGLSMFHLVSAVSNPFRVSTDTLYQSKQIVGLTDAQQQEVQKKMDTDGDGLSDWDETNLYHTNPYLRDSCGDGIPDNIRVLTGKNLQCQDTTPPTQGIVDTSLLATSTNNGIMSADPNVVTADIQNSVSSSAPTDAATPPPTPSNAIPRDPAAIRQLLKGQIPDSELNSISDADLLQIYDQAVADASASSTAGAASSTGATDASTSSTL